MINRRQYNILSFYLTRALFLGGGLSLLVSLSRNDLLVSGIVGMLFGYFLLYLFFKKGSINNIISVFIAIGILFMNILSNQIFGSDLQLNKESNYYEYEEKNNGYSDSDCIIKPMCI